MASLLCVGGVRMLVCVAVVGVVGVVSCSFVCAADVSHFWLHEMQLLCRLCLLLLWLVVGGDSVSSVLILWVMSFL